MNSWRASLLALGCVLFLVGSAFAQGGGGGGGGGGRNAGGRGNRGNFDPAQMRERMFTRMKEQLGATDDEWKVLQPKVEKVMTAQRESRDSGRFGGFGGRGGRGGGGPGGGGDNQPQTDVAKASQALRAALDDKATSTEEIAKRLAELRQARAKARAELQAAQKELKELLTTRQEAILVRDGMLE